MRSAHLFRAKQGACEMSVPGERGNSFHNDRPL